MTAPVSGRLGEPLWVIIGAMTGPGSKRKQPKREWVEAIAEVAQSAGVPVFMKNSLKELWGGPLSEYPEGMVRVDGE